MKNRLRFLDSIRWRLPLSYAGIALLATLALGVLLLSTLRSYYDSQEQKYLTDNADVISKRLERLYHEDAPDFIFEAEINNFAFITQSSVRLLDPDEKVVLFSENPVGFEISRAPFYRSIEFKPGPNGDTIMVDVLDPALNSNTGTVEVFEGQSRPSDFIASGLPINSNVAVPIDTAAPSDYTVTFGHGVWLDNSLFGYRLRLNEPSATEKSDQIVMVPIAPRRGQHVLGYVELSDGPAFGDEIVDAVARQFVGAGVAAVVIAALMGWIFSRRISQPVLALSAVTTRMAEGELSARADTQRRDEIGMLSRSFNQMAQRIEKTVVTLRQFVADAAHELNTPITALQTNLELAASESQPEERRQYINHAQAQLLRLETLTSSLLDLARLEATAKQDFANVDISSLVHNIYDRYASSAEQREIELSIEIEKEPVIIEGNIHQLQQVVENLLDNALKFTPSGGTIHIGLSATEHEAHLYIQDNGIGIPENDLPRLFNRFHRGRNAASYPGNGLGLVISKAIIEGHGGAIQAEQCDSGTRFMICIPIKQSEERTCEDASQSHPTH